MIMALVACGHDVGSARQRSSGSASSETDREVASGLGRT
jgi:hypothetical protein